jgi:hypothetical protein
MLRTAHKAAAGTTWLKEVQPLSAASFDDEPVDEEAVRSVLSAFAGPLRSTSRFNKQVAGMLAGLAQSESDKYEAALVTLGTLLGADSFKPPGKGRADAVWIWLDSWATVEAKSEQESEGMLSMNYVRQTNTQLASVAADREADQAPEGSFSIIVTPRGVVDPDAVSIAQGHVYLAAPKLIQDVAHDAARAWNELRGVAPGVTGQALHDAVARVLWQHRVLPTQVKERLTRDPIRGL